MLTVVNIILILINVWMIYTVYYLIQDYLSITEEFEEVDNDD